LSHGPQGGSEVWRRVKVALTMALPPGRSGRSFLGTPFVEGIR